MKIRLIFFSFFTILNLNISWCNSTIIFDNQKVELDIGLNILILEDKTGKQQLKDVLKKDFYNVNSKVVNLGATESSFWIKFSITNKTPESEFLLSVALTTLDKIDFYYPNSTKEFKIIKGGENYKFNQRKYLEPSFLFDFNLNPEETKTFYLHIASSDLIQLPITIGSKTLMINNIKNKDTLSGIYFGIMLVMIFYNLFIFYSTKDKNYIYYVIYIFSVFLTQMAVEGYTFKFLWPNSSIVAKMSLIVLPSITGITGVLFMNAFLKVKEFNKLLYKASLYFFIPYLICILLSFFQLFKISYLLMEINAGLLSMLMLVTAISIFKKGYQPAKYFLFAWGVFLIGVIIFILKDLEILPFNNLTRYTMLIGSAIETILLSFALAARINIYKKERMEAIQENEIIIREQNVVLEHKVKERTIELNKTLSDLKNTQSQLVEAEKMSSLGQLTAGIAHEINNPINFVSSNIPPLRQDIEDLKQVIAKYEELKVSDDIQSKLKEISDLKEALDYDYLTEELNNIVNGIEEGASRTAEIVSGLRTFSRLDEGSLKDVDINEGISSTLVLVKSKLNNITLTQELEKLPKVECNPGKINQLFMNLIDNAIFAVQQKYLSNEGGLIKISSSVLDGNKIRVIIEDNGVGIPENIKQKLFDPFFTTKKVGEGTGLGLSIVRNIIENHNGQIIINSEKDKGTKITIVLPQKKNK